MLAEPTTGSRPYDVMVIPVGRPTAVLVMSSLLGFRTHYRKSTMLCPGDAHCRACLGGWQAKYVGYIVVHDGRSRRLLRLTDGPANRVIKERLDEPGLTWTLVKERSRSPLSIRPGKMHAGYDPASSVHDAQLISLVARLHGLGSLGDGLSVDEAAEAMGRRAAKQIEHMMF